MNKFAYNKFSINNKNLYKHKSIKPYWYKKPLKHNIGHLLFFKRHSNIFVVITNYLKKHLYTVTAGNALLGKKKKEKMAVHNLIKLITKVLALLKFYKITCIYISLKQYFNRHFFTLYNYLKKNHIYIIGFRYLLQKPHGFMKRRKLRRV